MIYTGYKFHFALIKGLLLRACPPFLKDAAVRAARVNYFPRLIKGVYETRIARQRAPDVLACMACGLAPYANEFSEARGASALTV